MLANEVEDLCVQLLLQEIKITGILFFRDKHVMVFCQNATETSIL